MIIGVPKEIKNNECRIALTPAGAMEFVRRGHTVCVQSGAGVSSGYADEDYSAVGVVIVEAIVVVFGAAVMFL